MLMEEGICVLSPCTVAQCIMAGTAVISNQLCKALSFVFAAVTMVQLYVDLEKTVFRSENNQILPSALCPMPSQTH